MALQIATENSLYVQLQLTECCFSCLTDLILLLWIFPLFDRIFFVICDLYYNTVKSIILLITLSAY